MRNTTGFYMRIVHRYLGFFLVGIMAMYALSGIIMIFRQTDFLKRETKVERSLKAHLSPEALGKELRMRDLKVVNQEGDLIFFSQGQYNSGTGLVSYSIKELPYFLDKMTKLHKATTNSPVYWLNIGFGLSLLFFVVSSFWMFIPKTSVFKKGLYFALAGMVLTLILILI